MNPTPTVEPLPRETRARRNLTPKVVRRVALLTSLAAVMAACQIVVRADEVQCRVDRDCVMRGGSFAGSVCVAEVCMRSSEVDATPAKDAGATKPPETACLGKVTWLPQSTSEKITFRGRFVRLINEDDGVVNATVRACSVVDPLCSAPTANTTTDAKGDFALELPRNYRGYIELTQGSGGFAGMVPLMLWLIPPPDTSTATDTPAPTYRVVSASELNFLLNQAGTSLDVDAGHISSRTHNCLGVSGGVSLSINPRSSGVVPYYYGGNGTPNVQATESDPSGRAGFLNVPPGSVVVTATVAATGEVVGSYPLIVRKGTFTLFEPYPAP